MEGFRAEFSGLGVKGSGFERLRVLGFGVERLGV